jgi:hypothetical protein
MYTALSALYAAQPASEPLLRIPPVRTSINVENQPIEITAWGTVFATPAHSLRLETTLDLGNFQDNLTPIMRAKLNESDKCGTRMSVDRAVLTATAPSSVLTANLHYERYGCVKALGKQIVKRLVGGNAVVTVNLTPSVDQNHITLTAKVLKIDADGSLGEVLRSGSVGESIRKKAAESIESAVRKAANPKATLPPALEEAATIQTVQFADDGRGRLWLNLMADVHLSPEQLQDLQKRLPH